MEMIRRLEDLKTGVPSVVTIGVFDGVHLGHQAIMKIVKSASEKRNARSAVFTFDRNPEELINPGREVPYITTLHQKLKLIEEQGIDLAIVIPLESSILSMPAEQFVTDILHDKLSAIQIVIGESFAFGSRRAGDITLLQKMGHELGFEAVAVPPVSVGNMIVSSTAIRGFIVSGRIEKANEMLGHPFALEGTVVAGEGIGRSLGFPTANIQPADKQIVPANGVYAVSLILDGVKRIGVANIGNRPTVGGENTVVEVHIVDFSEDIYGMELEIDFHHRLRNELQFSDIEALKKQIARDIERAVCLVE